MSHIKRQKQYTKYKFYFDNNKYKFKTTISKYCWERKIKTLILMLIWNFQLNKFGCTLLNMEKATKLNQNIALNKRKEVYSSFTN